MRKGKALALACRLLYNSCVLKRLFLVLLSLYAIRGMAFAVQFAPSIIDAEHSITASFTMFCGNMSDPYPHTKAVAAGGEVSYELDAKTLFVLSSFSLTKCTGGFTFQTVYWPLWGEHFNAGAGAVVHFKACEDAFNETDVLIGGWTRWRGKRFEFNANIDYMIKASRIHAIDRYVPRIANNSMALAVECKWHIAPWRVCVWGGLSSWSTASFMLFFAPRWSAGAEFEITQGHYIGIEATAVYIDMATLSSYCEGTEIKCFARWVLKAH